MKFGVYSLFDKKQGVYSGISCYGNDVICRRAFERIYQNLDYEAKHPDEFAVYKVGEFDSDKGEMIPQAPVLLFELSIFAVDDGNK